MNVDEVIVSSDDSPMFLNYWPIAAKSWRKLFDIPPVLVVVSTGKLSSSMISSLTKFGEVEIVSAIKDVPVANQAKLARWFIASKRQGKVVSIEDIDTIFLKSDYLLNKWSNLRKGFLLGIGDIVEANSQTLQKFPASNFTGESELFADLFGVKADSSFEEFVHSFRGLNICDDLENPFSKRHRFSDESLIRALRVKNSEVPINLIPREIDVHRDWLDRSWWPDRIELEKYTTVNFLRPMYENRELLQPVINIFFQDPYPWILKRKTPFFYNQDHWLRLLVQRLRFGVRNRLSHH